MLSKLRRGAAHPRPLRAQLGWKTVRTPPIPSHGVFAAGGGERAQYLLPLPLNTGASSLASALRRSALRRGVLQLLRRGVADDGRLLRWGWPPEDLVVAPLPGGGEPAGARGRVSKRPCQCLKR